MLTLLPMRPSRRRVSVRTAAARAAVPILLLLLLLAPALLPAQPLEATLPLPPGGNVQSLALDPFQTGHDWLGTSTGLVYQSVDAGRHWRFAGEIVSRTDWVVARLVADPAHRGWLYAGLWSLASSNGGVFRSTDGGRSWRPLLLHHSVRAVVQAPSNPRLLVAGAIDGVFRSRDAGAHWRQISPRGGAAIVTVVSLAIDPRDPSNIYVGTWHLPWKTFDGGRHWIRISRGVIDDSDVFSIAIDPLRPARVYLSACSGIYRSDTAGMFFRKIQGIPYSARRTQDIEPDPSHPRLLFAGTTLGLWLSRDGGDHWIRTTPETLVVNAVLLDPHRPGWVLLGTSDAGILVSHDGGMHFAESNHGFANRQVSALIADPARQRFYLAITGAGARGGVFVTSDRGARWRPLRGGLGRAQVHALLLGPAGLLAGTGDGLYRWGPGATWHAVAALPTAAVYALTAVPGAGAPLLYAATARGLFRSPDGGLHWTLLPAAPIPTYSVAATGSQVLAAGAGFVLRSTDGGRHFPFAAFSVNGRVNQLAHRGGLWLAATSQGLYFWNGLTPAWQLAGHGLPAEEIRSIHWQSDGIYVSTSAAGRLYRSRDGARHWQVVPVSPVWAREARNLLGPLPPEWVEALNGSAPAVEAMDIRPTRTSGFHLGRRIPTLAPAGRSPAAPPPRPTPFPH